MFRTLSLGLFCFTVWLLLSGFVSAVLLGFGMVSCVLVIVIARRMQIIDAEGHPVQLFARAPGYWFWLIKEIIKANIDVAKRVLDPTLPISPTLIRVKAVQHTALGRVIYANSITLTPGTLAIRLQKDEIEVYALTREAAERLLEGEMARRVNRLEGRH